MSESVVTPQRVFRKGALILGATVTCGELSGIEEEAQSVGTLQNLVLEQFANGGRDQLHLGDADSYAVAVSFQLPPVWNEAAERRFEELVELEAVEEIAEEELKELDHLQASRRQALSPRTFDEIKREVEMDSVFDELVDALTKLRRMIPANGEAE